MKIFLTIVVLLTFHQVGLGQNQIPGSVLIPKISTLRPMNGLNPEDYEDFWEKWPLVSVRYREDNKEQRFVYANSIAMEAMKKGAKIYPDGSVFGKITFITQKDPNFPNSVEPAAFSRMQIMEKNEKRFTETDGWSYLLYLNPENLKKKDDHSRLLACHSCHKLVEKLDHVFTRPTFLGNFKTVATLAETNKFRDKFKPIPNNEMRGFEKQIVLLSKFPNRKFYIHRMKFFVGSVSESITPLSYYPDNSSSYILVSKDNRRFLLSEKLSSTKHCKDRIRILYPNQLKFRIHKAGQPHSGKDMKEVILQEDIICDGKRRPSDKIRLSKELKKWINLENLD